MLGSLKLSFKFGVLNSFHLPFGWCISLAENLAFLIELIHFQVVKNIEFSCTHVVFEGSASGVQRVIII